MTTQAINADTADIPSVNFAQQSGDVAAPAAGRWQLFFKAGGLYARANTGAVVGPFIVNPLTTQDDLVVGGAAGAQDRLAKGSDGQVLTVNPTTHHLNWAAPAASGALTLISTQTVGAGGAASIAFATIPSTYAALRLVLCGRGLAAAALVNVYLRFNGDSGANYAFQYVQTSNGSTSTGGAASQTYINPTYAPAASAAAGHYLLGHFTLPNYADTAHYKGITGDAQAEAGTAGADMLVWRASGRWWSTSAITDIAFTLSSGNWAEGSWARLYGMAAS